MESNSSSSSSSTTATCSQNPKEPMMAATAASSFLRVLLHIQQTTAAAGCSSLSGRSRRIRRAAYASMACSAGARRAWSRALLRKLRNRSVTAAPRRVRVRARVNVGRRCSRSRRGMDEEAEALLRKLVPGGTGMDYCSLLEETADYVRCLAAQVRLMQSVMDSISSS